MNRLELIDIISRTGMEYHEDDFTTTADIIWLYFIDTNMFTEDELALVIDLNGYSEKTLYDMLFSRYGYRDLPQYLESEVLYESTKISKRQVVSVLKSAGLQPSDYYIDSDNYIVLYTYKQYEVVEMLEKVFGERAVEFTRDDGVVAIKGFVKGAIHENKTLTEDEITFISEMRYKDYVIEFFKDTQYGQYYWQAEYDGDDRKLSNFNVWITTRGISLSYQDNEGYPTKANAVSKAKEWVDKQKRRWDDSLTEAADIVRELNDMMYEYGYSTTQFQEFLKDVYLNKLTDKEFNEFGIKGRQEVIDYAKEVRAWKFDSLTEATTGFTIEYPNGEFYIGKPMDLYVMMTDFLIDWDNDKTTMTEYEAENVASIRDNYKEVFYAALEGGNYWKAHEFEEAFGRFSDYGIANALSINENRDLEKKN